MSNLNSRLGRIERRIGEQPCTECATVKRYHIVRSPDLIDPAWFRCRLCGRRRSIKIVIMEDASDDLAGGDVAVH